VANALLRAASALMPTLERSFSVTRYLQVTTPRNANGLIGEKSGPSPMSAAGRLTGAASSRRKAAYPRETTLDSIE
jgi:hypothetical protein